MTPIVWLTDEAVLALHDVSLAQHGGASGVRDEGLLSSALKRPQNRWLYEDITDAAMLAATYAVAISGNHPFFDGNKRTAFAALLVFLEINGLTLTASTDDATATMLAVAAGEMDLDALSAWVRANAAPARS